MDKLNEEIPTQEQEDTEAMPDETTQDVKPRHNFMMKIETLAGDKKFENDNDLLDYADTHLDGLSAYKDESIKRNQKISELLDDNPDLVDLIQLMDKGATLREAIAHVYSQDELTPSPDAPDYDAWMKAHDIRKGNRANKQKFEDELAENTEISKGEIAAWAEEKGITPDESEQFLTKVNEMLDDVFKGKVTKKLLTDLYNGMNSESDIATARTQGEISGRNQKILTEREKATPDVPIVKSGSNDEIAPVKQGYLKSRGLIS